ncbi:MAG: hypothetical protein EOO38_22670 [Cytophagaceae bacterium]|nr:MAG: hypothetical protein EOO38_22670 [Cytophagaceae bacterium]
MKDHPDFTKIILDLSDNEYKEFDGTETRAFLTLLRKNLNKTITASDDPYGYWITPDGKINEVDVEGHFA